MDFKDMLTNLINQHLGEINRVAQKKIRDKGYEPLGGESHKNIDLGSIYIIVADAKAELDYSLQGIKGLSNCGFNHVDITKLNTSIDGSKVDATAQFTFGTNKQFTSYANCRISAEACAFGHNVCHSESVKPYANISMNGLEVTGRISISGTIDQNEIIVERISADLPNLNLGTIDIDLSGMGFFDTFFGEVKRILLDVFRQNLNYGLRQVFPLVIEGLNEALLPKSIHAKV